MFIGMSGISECVDELIENCANINVGGDFIYSPYGIARIHGKKKLFHSQSYVTDC